MPIRSEIRRARRIEPRIPVYSEEYRYIRAVWHAAEVSFAREKAPLEKESHDR